jgi:hypothetical protein
MADNDISVESVEVPLLSEIGMSSATRIKGAYQSRPGGKAGEGISPLLPGDDEVAGPNALVYATKITNPVPAEVTDHPLRGHPERETMLHGNTFFIMVLVISLRLGDPSTTRLINGTIDVTFPPDVTILDYTPRDKGCIASLIEKGGDGISISPYLVLGEPLSGTAKTSPGHSDNRFRIPLGHGHTRSGTYTPKAGYSFALPSGKLLEYQGMIKNPHDLFFEIYPPMPPGDTPMTGTQMLAIFSVIIRTPGNTPSEINVHIDCRVKGNLWGVIPLRGSVVFT